MKRKPRSVAVASRPKPKDRQNTDTPALRSGGIRKCQTRTTTLCHGQKNYLFSHDDKEAEDNAVFYSLLKSCDVVQLNPLDWLTEVLSRLRDNMDEEEITQLLPYQYKKSRE